MQIRAIQNHAITQTPNPFTCLLHLSSKSRFFPVSTLSSSSSSFASTSNFPSPSIFLFQHCLPSSSSMAWNGSKRRRKGMTKTRKRRKWLWITHPLATRSQGRVLTGVCVLHRAPYKMMRPGVLQGL